MFGLEYRNVGISLYLIILLWRQSWQSFAVAVLALEVGLKFCDYEKNIFNMQTKI